MFHELAAVGSEQKQGVHAQFLSRNSALEFPSFGQGGEAAAADRGGGGSNRWGRTTQQRDSSRSHHPRGAVRHIPSSAEEGNVSCNSSFEFRDRN